MRFSSIDLDPESRANCSYSWSCYVPCSRAGAGGGKEDDLPAEYLNSPLAKQSQVRTNLSLLTVILATWFMLVYQIIIVFSPTLYNNQEYSFSKLFALIPVYLWWNSHWYVYLRELEQKVLKSMFNIVLMKFKWIWHWFVTIILVL